MTPPLFEACADYRHCPRLMDTEPGCHTCARQCGEYVCPIFSRRFRKAAGLPPLPPRLHPQLKAR